MVGSGCQAYFDATTFREAFKTSSRRQSAAREPSCDTGSPPERSESNCLRLDKGQCRISVGCERGAGAAWTETGGAGVLRLADAKGQVASDATMDSVAVSLLTSKTKSGGSHCERHARDYSDCMALHFKRRLQVSPLQAMMNAVKQGLQGTREGRSPAPISPSRRGAFTMRVADDSVSASGREMSSDFGDSDNDGPGDDIGRDGDEREKDSAFGWKEGNKRKLVKRSIPGERIVKQRTLSESRGSDMSEGGRFRNGSVSTVLESVSSIGLEKPIDEHNISGPRDVAREVLTQSMDGDEAEAPNDSNESLRKFSKLEEAFLAEDSQFARRDGDCASVVCGVRPSRRFSGNRKVHATITETSLLDDLSPDVLLKIFSLLDALSLARCGVLTKHLKALAHEDSLWVGQCVKLWEGKVHLPCYARQDGLPKVVAYSRSVRDAKRTRITSDDLCEHNWEFRFTSAAPPYWRRLDPAHRGEAPMKRYFHKDGSITAAPGDEVWGGHECFYSIVDKEGADGILEHFVQINNWPCMAVSRTSDWGWVLSNTVHVYQSTPDAEGGT